MPCPKVTMFIRSTMLIRDSRKRILTAFFNAARHAKDTMKTKVKVFNLIIVEIEKISNIQWFIYCSNKNPLVLQMQRVC